MSVQGERPEFGIVDRWRWVWFTISAVVIVSGLVAWRTWGLNLGIDFTGGTIMKLGFAEPIAQTTADEATAIAKTRQVLKTMGLAKSQIQVADRQWLIIRLGASEGADLGALRDHIKQRVQDAFGTLGGGIKTTGDLEMVGPVVGGELRRAAVLALVLGNLLIMVYVTLRYKFNMAVAAIMALVHDVFVMAAGASVLRLELNTDFIAALLTVVGYSMNDTVVIFDRIRENRQLHRHAPFNTVANASLIQTMARSINTIATVLFTLVALALFGGATIRGFAIALVIGVTTGCYSSVFNASPLLALWGDWHEWGLGRSFRWRAFLAGLFAIVPAAIWYSIALGSGTRLLGLPPSSQVGLRLLYDLAVVGACWGLGFVPAWLWGDRILRVLAGAATLAPGAQVALRPSAAVAAATSTAGAAAGTEARMRGSMQAAAAAARAERAEERKARRKARKARAQRKPGQRRKRF